MSEEQAGIRIESKDGGIQFYFGLDPLDVVWQTKEQARLILAALQEELDADA